MSTADLFRRTLAAIGLALCALPAAAQNRTPVADPSKCPDLWAEIGLPEGKPQGKDKFIVICHLGYVSGHNNVTKAPDWVIERVRPKLADATGEATRESQDFHADELILPPSGRAVPADYDHSGFDQGHQAPAADFKGDQKLLDDTFFYSNSVPQVGRGFNRSIWRSLETQVRKLSTGPRDELYVITGPVYQQARPIKIVRGADACGAEFTLKGPENGKASICPANSDEADPSARCTNGVAVPVALFKIVYDAKVQNAFAVLMENKSHTGQYPSNRTFEYIKKHAVSIGTIEDLTGFSFFSALDERRQRQIRQNCATFKFH